MSPPPENSTPDDQLWTKVLGQLQMQMTRATFDTWVKNTRLVSRDDETLVIGAESAFVKDWLENRLFSTIHRAASNMLDHPVEIQFVVDGSVESANGREHRPANAPARYKPALPK